MCKCDRSVHYISRASQSSGGRVYTLPAVRRGVRHSRYGGCRSGCPKRPSPCPVGKGTALINGNRPTRPQPTSHHQSASSVFQCRRSSSLDVVWSTARRVCSSQHSFFHDFPHVNILSYVNTHGILSTLYILLLYIVTSCSIAF